MDSYIATVADQSYEVQAADLERIDLVGPFSGKYHLIQGGISYVCEIVEAAPFAKRLVVSVNRRRFTVDLADSYDATVARLGLATSVEVQTNDVSAPMPGLILQILVAAGDEVEAGEPLLVLEAMKMENVIKAEGTGTVAAVHVQQGDAVDKRQLLIEMQ